MSERALIIVPTYNERENIERLIASALAQDARLEILVVDDGSPDGTGDIVERIGQGNARVHLLRRPRKMGLGTAYIAGFRWALARDYGYVFEMDADFSHDPADLARLVATAEGGADLVLGSRYVAGGSVTDWGAVRRLVSRGGSWYARIVLGLRARDLTGGFKCFRREVLEAIDLPTVRSKGYAFQVELTHRAVRAGFAVVEIPIVFRDRRLGRSKMSWRIAGEAALLVPRLRAGRGARRRRRG